MRCLPVTPHENTELLVNPGPNRIHIGHMTQYDIMKYSIVHVDIAQFHAWVYRFIGGTLLSGLPLIATQ